MSSTGRHAAGTERSVLDSARDVPVTKPSADVKPKLVFGGYRLTRFVANATGVFYVARRQRYEGAEPEYLHGKYEISAGGASGGITGHALAAGPHNAVDR